MNKDNIQKGNWYFAYLDEEQEYIIMCGRDIYFTVHSLEFASFICESFNVFSKTGMTPEELFKEFAQYEDSEQGQQISNLKHKIEQLQQQIEEALEHLKKERKESGFTINLYNAYKSLNTPQEEKPSKKELSEVLYSMVKNFECTYKEGSAAESSINHAKKLLK